MIHASTVSEREARVAVAALARTVPADMGWAVYLCGSLFNERPARPPADIPDDVPAWPAGLRDPLAELRDGREE